jgi:hypothetical protein
VSTTFNPADIYTNSSTTGSTASKNPFSSPSYNSGASSIAGYNFPDFSSYMSGVRSNTSDLLGQQNASVGNYLSNYSAAINNQETVPAMWQRLANETGYNALNKQALDINNQLNYLPQTETAAMKGFDVNNNQLMGDINQQTWKLAPIAQRATAQAQNAANIMGQQISATQAQQQKELTPYTAEGQFLTDYLARQTSMFTQENEMEMNSLVNKMNAGVTLTNAEQQRLNDLKIAEEGYKNKLQLQQMQGTVLGKTDTYYNPWTGTAYNPYSTVAKP